MTPRDLTITMCGLASLAFLSPLFSSSQTYLLAFLLGYQWRSGGPRTLALAVPTLCYRLSSAVSWLTYFLQIVAQRSSSLSVVPWLHNLIFSLIFFLDSIYFLSCFFFFSLLSTYYYWTHDLLLILLREYAILIEDWQHFLYCSFSAVFPVPRAVLQNLCWVSENNSRAKLKCYRILLICLLTLNAT